MVKPSKVPPAAVDPLAEAEAAVEQAQHERDKARDAVDAAVDAYPEGMRDRRLIASMPVAGPFSSMPDFMRSDEQRAAFERRRVFDDALVAEGVAVRALRDATAARDALRRAAETATLGDGRAALARAIAIHTEAVEKAGVARQTVERARGALVAAQTAHSIAESVLGEARERAIGAVTAVEGVQPPELRDLRRRVADAADDLDIASAALARAELATAEPDYQERKASEAVGLAADQVIAVQAQAAWDAVVAARDEVKRAEAVFSAVSERLPSDTSDDVRYLREQGSGLIFYHDDVSQRVRAAAQSVWRAAHAALLRDPQAELPSLT